MSDKKKAIELKILKADALLKRSQNFNEQPILRNSYQ